MDARIAEFNMRGKTPDTLTPAEIDLEKEPLTRTPIARPATTWVRYEGVPLLIDVEVVAWTDHAVAIRWRVPEGEHGAWVRASAIRAR